MKVPRLNRKLVLETPERLNDGSGGFVEGWVPLGVLWAEVAPSTGRETAMTGTAVSQMRYRITVRGAAVGQPARPAAQQRFREDTRVFTIEAVTERDPEGRFLVCFAHEEQVV